MNAGYIMTRQVVTVGPEANVVDIARLMLERNISGVPVVDEEMRVLGIVSEGDLVRRHEIGTARRHSWLLNFITGSATQAQEYTKAHAKRAGDIMTSPAITVTEDATIDEIAETLEKNHIKRVPVVRGGRLIGIVSRANIVQLVASAKPLEVPIDASDDKIRRQIMDVLDKQPWASLGLFNVTVNKGVVEFWGFVRSEAEQRAARTAAESVGGVKRVEDHRSVRDLSTISGV